MDYVHISIAGFLAGEILHSDDNFSHCTFRNETPCEKLGCVPQKITYNYSDANKNHDTLTCHLQSIYPEILSFGIARRKKKAFGRFVRDDRQSIYQEPSLACVLSMYYVYPPLGKLLNTKTFSTLTCFVAAML